jgi:tRNA pseudouridine32 synthase/23S rRNA pseudouridine746 synthase
MDAAYIMERLLHRDGSVLVLDKPAGLPVHRERDAPHRETLTDWLEPLRFGLPRPPQIAHRLDRATSGCLVLGRHPTALRRLAELFGSGEIGKLYWAVVEGVPSTEAGEIDRPLGEVSTAGARRMAPDPLGKVALTRWRLLATRGGRSWLALEPVTGRTHQLRVHLAASGWPILGDRLYGGGDAPRLMLHARAVTIPFRPRKLPLTVEAPAPPALSRAIMEAGGNAATGQP